MSQIYTTEPTPTGRIIIETSSNYGLIDINLYCKECPIVTKLFLQLCIDGYYDGMIFHRIIHDFLLQTGSGVRDDDNGWKLSTAQQDVAAQKSMHRYMKDIICRSLLSSSSSSSSSTIPFTKTPSASTNKSKKLGAVLREMSTKIALETSSRIRFDRRGVVALALPIDHTISSNSTSTHYHNEEEERGDEKTIFTSPEEEEEAKMTLSLLRQFFVTLDNQNASFLHGKHVAFGSVKGATIFNVLRMGQTEVVDDDTNDEDKKGNFGDGGNGNGTPIDMDNAPRIQRIKIDYHPFGDDLVQTEDQFIPWKQHAMKGGKDGSNGRSHGVGNEESKIKKARRKRKGKRDFNVLSFGDEMTIEEDIDEVNKTGSGNNGDNSYIRNKKKDKKKTKKKSTAKVKSDNNASFITSDVDKVPKEKDQEGLVEESEQLHVTGNLSRTTNNPDTSDRLHIELTNKSQKEKNYKQLGEIEVNEQTVDGNTAISSYKHDEPTSKNNVNILNANKVDKNSKRNVNNQEIYNIKKKSAVEMRKDLFLASRRAKSSPSSMTSLHSQSSNCENNNNNKTKMKKIRDNDTMSKLVSFKRRMASIKSVQENDNNIDNNNILSIEGSISNNSCDRSIDSRMAKRCATMEEKRVRKKNGGKFTGTCTYAGQVLEKEDDVYHEYKKDGLSNKWLKSKFKCQHHMDHESKGIVISMGGDGRNMDDYCIVDEKKTRKSKVANARGDKF